MVRILASRFGNPLINYSGDHTQRKGGIVPHFKCAACRTRLHSTSALADLAEELCPDCGALLTPAVGPSELVGFRAITPGDDVLEEPLAEDIAPVADLFARRASHEQAHLDQARLDFERWGDDGGLAAEAVAMPWRDGS